MFHRFGRSEPSDTRIAYDPPAHAFPLLHTFRFDRAREIMDAVKREPGFVDVLDRSVEAWKRLARPRHRAHVD
jgi:hypothetical protein